MMVQERRCLCNLATKNEVAEGIELMKTHVLMCYFTSGKFIFQTTNPLSGERVDRFSWQACGPDK